VNPDIGAQGAGAGKRVNYAMLENYYSFPEGLNDPDRKQYGPDGPRRVALLTNTPLIVKTSTTANTSVAAGEIIEYNIVAPLPPIRSNLYDATVYDVLPDGLSFGGSGTVNGVGPGPVSLNIGDGDGQVPGDEVVVTGGRGEVSISVVGRRLDVNIKKIDAEGGGHDQVTVTVRCLVKSAFSNGRPIPRLHKFVNNASLLWYDDDVSFPDRVRYAVVSPDVCHFYNATGILFEPSQTGTAQPGTIRIYRHVLRNFENNPITVPITFSSTQKDWVWQLFTGDGNGNMVEGPYEVETLANNESRCYVSVPADGMTEVIMRVFVPTDITSMITDVLTVTATGGGNISTITDVTVTTAERIAVFKEVSTGTEAYTTRLQVQPTGSNAVNQRIRFFNNGPENVKEVYIYDFIPNYTVYIANSAVNTPEYALQYSKDGGVNWTVGEPAAKGESVVDGTVPAVTNLRWYYNEGGALTPGDEHVITFQLRIK
ncbi:MAG: isopeptide-forming domain-containing fimbrial protein, partial [Lentisphaeria bacterium]